MEQEKMGTAAEGTAAETQGDVSQDTPPESLPQEDSTLSDDQKEIQRLTAELEASKANLKRIEADRAGQSSAITRLANERDAALRAQAEAMNKKISLLGRRESLGEDEYQKEMQAIDTELAEDTTAAQRESQMLTAIDKARGILAKANIDLDADTPSQEAIQVRSAFNNVATTGGSLADVIALTSEIAMTKLLEKQPSPDKLKEEGKQKAIEDLKKSPAFKSDHSGAISGQDLNALSPRELLRLGSKTDYD